MQNITLFKNLDNRIRETKIFNPGKTLYINTIETQVPQIPIYRDAGLQPTGIHSTPLTLIRTRVATETYTYIVGMDDTDQIAVAQIDQNGWQRIINGLPALLFLQANPEIFLN